MKLGKGDSGNTEFGLVGQGIEIAGDIVFADQLHVYGKIAGKLNSKSGTLVVGESGQVDAEVDVGICVVQGALRGNLIARTKLEIRRTGRVTGDIVTPVLLVEEGAVFDGVIRMSEESASPKFEDISAPEVAAEAPRQAWRA
jgi:cytoskeletal protein CcmA (bactofilin family)